MSWKDRASNLAGDFTDKATDAAQNAGEYFEDAGEYLEGKIREAWNEIDEDKQQAIKEVAEKTIEKKQEISGEAMHQEVMEMVQKQEEYNDLLASKLAEALKRIERLEENLDDTS